ncbi:nuclear transport factor 2 family protein [Daejeonella sp.]|uniref:nuclear transport factor 2 family protein n=1 Tax=Daejeonella sp. TaxID=2805397 RepID=UPI0030C2064E
MKKILGILTLFCAFNVANAQTKQEIAVAAAVETLNKGMLNPDKALLENIASEGLSYGHSGGKIQNKAEFVEDLLHGIFDFLSITTSNQKITASGKNAIVRHTFVAKATNSGNPIDVNMEILLVWRKESGKWQLLARQAFKIPGT